LAKREIEKVSLFGSGDERRWEGAQGWKSRLNASSQSSREIFINM